MENGKWNMDYKVRIPRLAYLQSTSQHSWRRRKLFGNLDTFNMTRNTTTLNTAPLQSKRYQPYIAQDKPFDKERLVSVFPPISLLKSYWWSSKAVIVGAGIAGIAAAILLQNKVPNLTYTIFDKNKRVVSISFKSLIDLEK